MINSTALKILALATSCLVPLAAYAADDGGFDIGNAPAAAAQEKPAPQYDNEVGFGLKGVMGTNAGQAGRYDGQNVTGIDEVIDFSLHSHDDWKSGGTRYYDFTGTNLVFQDGRDSAGGFHDSKYLSKTADNFANDGSVNVKVGDQGTWGINGYYDAISYTGNIIDSIYTINGNQGTLNGGLPAWGGATAGSNAGANLTTTAGFTYPYAKLNAAETPFQTGTRRDIVGGDAKYISGNWTFSAAGRHEHKSGTMEESLRSTYGGTAFTMPIDYDTNRYDVSAAYNTHMLQAVIQNSYSHFEDDNTFVVLPYPVAQAAIPYQLSAAYATPPSNDADYLTVMLATNALPDVRINVNARYGLEMQDSTFAPNTADPNPTGFTNLVNLNSSMQGTGTNTSLGAVAEVYQANIAATAHPFTNTDGRLFYNVDGRDVHQDVKHVCGGGTSPDANASDCQTARPQGWLKQKFGGEAGYKLLPASDTKLTVGYKRDEVDRSNAQVESSYTNTESLGVRSNFGSRDLRGSLTYEHADRSGSLNYLTPWVPLGQSVTYSGAYYQAPMVSDAIKLRTDYAPTEELSGGLYIQFKNENYDYPADTNGGVANGTVTGWGQGIKNDYNLTVGPDVNYRPAKDINTHFYYSYEQIFYNNFGNGACSTPAQAATAACLGTVGYFQNQYTSSVNTVGLGGDWKVNSKLKVGADYNFAYGSVAFAEFNGVFVASPTQPYQNLTNYPDISSVMHNLQLKASYELMPDMELVAQYAFTMFRNNDWNDYAAPVQGAGGTSVSYMTPGYGTPNYNISTIMTGLKYKF